MSLWGTLEDNAVGSIFRSSPESDRRRQQQHQQMYRFRPGQTPPPQDEEPASLLDGRIGSLHDESSQEQSSSYSCEPEDYIDPHVAKYGRAALQPPPKGMLYQRQQQEDDERCGTVPTPWGGPQMPQVPREVAAIRQGDISSVIQGGRNSRNRNHDDEEEQDPYSDASSSYASFVGYRSQLELPTKNEAQDLSLDATKSRNDEDEDNESSLYTPNRYRSQLELPTKNEAQALSLDDDARPRRSRGRVATDGVPASSPQRSTMRQSLLEQAKQRHRNNHNNPKETTDRVLRQQLESQAENDAPQRAQLHVYREQQMSADSGSSSSSSSASSSSSSSSNHNLIKPDKRMGY